MNLLSLITVPLLILIPTTIKTIDINTFDVPESDNVYFELLKPDLTPKTATLVSLDIPWDSGDVIDAVAKEPVPECTDKEELIDNKCVPLPEPEPEVEEVIEIQEPASRSSQEISTTEHTYNENAITSKIYSLNDLMFQGLIFWEGYKYSFYSESVLNGTGLSIPNRHVNADGYVSDGDGYIVLAAPSGIPHGTVYPTPFGYMGKVYDTCASCYTSPDFWLDCYIR